VKAENCTYQTKVAVEQVVGPRADQERIPGIDIALRDGETWMFGEQPMRVLDTPGHTRGIVVALSTFIF